MFSSHEEKVEYAVSVIDATLDRIGPIFSTKVGIKKGDPDSEEFSVPTCLPPESMAYAIENGLSQRLRDSASGKAGKESTTAKKRAAVHKAVNAAAKALIDGNPPSGSVGKEVTEALDLLAKKKVKFERKKARSWAAVERIVESADVNFTFEMLVTKARNNVEKREALEAELADNEF